MRWPTRTGPRCSTMIVALGTNIDVRIILAEQRAGSRNVIVVGGRGWISELMTVLRVFMRIVTDHTGDPDIRVTFDDHRVKTGELNQTRAPRVTPSTTVDSPSVHVLHHFRMPTALPLIIGWMMGIRMTAPAHLAGDFDLRPDDHI